MYGYNALIALSPYIFVLPPFWPDPAFSAQEARVDPAGHAASGVVDPDVGLAVEAGGAAAGNLQAVAVMALAAADLVAVIIAGAGAQREVARLQAADGSPPVTGDAAGHTLKLGIFYVFNVIYIRIID